MDIKSTFIEVSLTTAPRKFEVDEQKLYGLKKSNSKNMFYFIENSGFLICFYLFCFETVIIK